MMYVRISEQLLRLRSIFQKATIVIFPDPNETDPTSGSQYFCNNTAEVSQLIYKRMNSKDFRYFFCKTSRCF